MHAESLWVGTIDGVARALWREVRQAATLRVVLLVARERIINSQADPATCNACPLKAQCTNGHPSICRGTAILDLSDAVGGCRLSPLDEGATALLPMPPRSC
jgi:hypothetical protein